MSVIYYRQNHLGASFPAPLCRLRPDCLLFSGCPRSFTILSFVTFERFADHTVEYTGHAQTYTLPKSNPGIASMTITGYDGIATPPVTVGDYVVNIDFVAAEGYKLPETLPAPVLHITRASGESGTVWPVLKDETVTYTGTPQRYHGADGIEGIASVALTYTGVDGVESTTAPTNAGTYTMTAIFSPDANHTLAAGDYFATLIIRKAGQDAPMASLESSSAHELTVSAIPGAEYSIDGGKTWQAPQTTKLLISISDGQPKAMPDYTGNIAVEDMKQIISQYSRQGILFLAAAIGQDKDAICDIYGQDRFIDITDLKQLPMRLAQIIAQYL